jgi:hypothetical protein
VPGRAPEHFGYVSHRPSNCSEVPMKVLFTFPLVVRVGLYLFLIGLVVGVLIGQLGDAAKPGLERTPDTSDQVVSSLRAEQFRGEVTRHAHASFDVRSFVDDVRALTATGF